MGLGTKGVIILFNCLLPCECSFGRHFRTCSIHRDKIQQDQRPTGKYQSAYAGQTEAPGKEARAEEADRDLNIPHQCFMPPAPSPSNVQSHERDTGGKWATFQRSGLSQSFIRPRVPNLKNRLFRTLPPNLPLLSWPCPLCS